MTYNSGTATDNIDMLDNLIEVVTSDHVLSASITAAGANYVAGEILDLDGSGTSTHVAQLEVTTFAAGAVTGVRVYRGGAYTVDPDLTANATVSTGFTHDGTATTPGTGATFDLTMETATWVLNRRSKQALSATIANGGTGYTVNDQLDVDVGDAVIGNAGSAPSFIVNTVAGGVVTAVTVASGLAGNLEEVATNPATTTGGTGSGCTLTITYGDTAKADSNDAVVMLQGEGSGGTDEIHVAIVAFSLANGVFDTAYNWSVLGATGFNPLLPLRQQTGLNPLQIDLTDGSLPANDYISGVVLKDADGHGDMTWWISHTGRRIILACKVDGLTTTMYSSMYAGFLNQMATAAEYPYPLLISGHCNVQNRLWTNDTDLTGGIVEVISTLGVSINPTGPGWLRLPDGTWFSFACANSSSGVIRQVETQYGIYPFINPATVPSPVRVVGPNARINWDDMIPPSGVGGSPTQKLKPTPGSGDSYYWLVAPIVQQMISDGAYPDGHRMFGEIDGVFWFNSDATVLSQDRFELGGKRYTVFQNGTLKEDWSHFALDED